MNNKAQLDYPIITVIIIIFGLLLIAPIILKTVNTINTNLGDSLGNMSNPAGNISKANANYILGTFSSFWDKVIIFAFFLSLIILFVSAFLIDAHPVFIVLYIFISFMVILFAPNIISSLDGIYTSSLYTAEVNQLSFMNTIRTYFGEFLVGIMVITGIIIYGKIAWSRRQ